MNLRAPFEWGGNAPTALGNRKTEQFLDHCICKGSRSSGPGCNFKMPPEVAAYRHSQAAGTCCRGAVIV